MNSLLTPTIYNFIIKDNSSTYCQPIKDILNTLRKNVPYFHSEYVYHMVSYYMPIECSTTFVAEFLHIIIYLYQDNFRLSKDKKIVGLETNKLNTDYIYDSINDGEVFDFMTSTSLNRLEQFYVYCLYQLINFREEEKIFNLYLEFKSNHSESITFFEKECPKENITLVSILSLQLYQTISLYNKDGINHDRRSLNNKDYMLSPDLTKVYYKWNLKDEVSILRDITFIRPTIYDLLVGFLTIKSGKYDRWYELYTSIYYSQIENKYMLEFDHGS